MEAHREHPDWISPPLPREFYERSPDRVAPDLLGKLLVRVTRAGLMAGRIVETEAYMPVDDPACHAYRGCTPRNAVMFGPGGFAYVYSIHARWCFNVVTLSAGVGSAVLVRAIEPLHGLDQMTKRRQAGLRRHHQRRGTRAPAARRQTQSQLDIARGPARLCEALDIDRKLNGWDLTHPERLWIARAAEPDASAPLIARSSRIGVTSAYDLPLRFFVSGSPFVSGGRSLNSCSPATGSPPAQP